MAHPSEVGPLDRPGLSPESRLCVWLCRRIQVRPPADHLDWLVDGEAFARLMARAVPHGVAGLVLSGLARLHDDGGLVPEVAREVHQALALVRRQATFWAMEQDRILAALGREGLEPVVLKGGALRHVAYARPVERTMGDLDLLVPAHEVESVLEALAALGYASPYPDAAPEGFREHHYHERVALRGFEIEVHWGLTRPGADLRLDADLVLRRARRVQPQGAAPLRVPSPEDNLLHAISQSEQGAVHKLSRMVDLDRIVASSDLDWDYVQREAARAGLDGFLALTLRLAHLTLGTPAPRAVLEGRALSLLSRRAVAAFDPVVHLMEPPQRAQVPRDNLIRFWNHRGLEAKARMLRTISAAEEDPLEWVWEIHEAMHGRGDAEGSRRKPVRGWMLLLKLAAVQAVLLPRALVAGPARRFWHGPVAGTHLESTD